MDTREQQITDKLSSLGMQNNRPVSEGSYDYIEQPDNMDAPINRTVSVSTTEEWEKQLLKDPKVVSTASSVMLASADYSVESTCSHSPLTAWQ